MNIRAWFWLVLSPLLLATGTAQAAQSYDNCAGTISALPAVVTTQGVWCMKQDLQTAITNGAAISINTNNVTIDCNDFKLGGLTAGAGTLAYGIFSDSHLNVTVRHCNVRGFFIGLYLKHSTGGGGHVVEDNRFDHNTYVAVKVEGDGSIIRRNIVTDTGGTTGVSQTAEGIDTFYNVDVIDNRISGLAATSGSNADAWGVYMSLNAGGNVIGNNLSGLVADGTGAVTGIKIGSGSTYVVVRDNNVIADNSIDSWGIVCDSGETTTKDNVTASVTTGIFGCTDGGGNWHTP